MRDILFKGKRVDNGKWVEGYYTELPCGSLGATIFSMMMSWSVKIQEVTLSKFLLNSILIILTAIHYKL